MHLVKCYFRNKKFSSNFVISATDALFLIIHETGSTLYCEGTLEIKASSKILSSTSGLDRFLKITKLLEPLLRKISENLKTTTSGGR